MDFSPRYDQAESEAINDDGAKDSWVRRLDGHYIQSFRAQRGKLITLDMSQEIAAPLKWLGMTTEN